MDEDLGYVTLEAMLSSKPVITCRDSGGPLEFVRNMESGLVAAPEAKEFASAMDEMWNNRPRARKWGETGKLIYKNMRITWKEVVEQLLK
jgi:glycosyltransferase involved in cell wall biosynthesis